MTEEKDEIGARKISTEPDVAVWFFAMKDGVGIKRTPRLSQRICPGVMHKACKELRLCPEAIATRNTVLMVKFSKEALAIGSKGGLDSASKTAGRLQEGASFLTGGRFRKKDRNNLVSRFEFDTFEPSEKPR